MKQKSIIAGGRIEACPSNGRMQRLSRLFGVIITICLICTAQPVSAFPPYKSTDADTADCAASAPMRQNWGGE